MNPHTLTWSNPTTRTDGSAFAAAQIAGYLLSLDGQPAVSVPASGGIQTFDMSTLAAFQALKPGNHTVALAVTDTGGLSSAMDTAVPFQIVAPPSVVTNLAVA